MNKKLIIICLIFCSLITIANSQNLKKQDSIKIAFKAKLLTTSEYGISYKEKILEDIQKQKIVFLNTVYENFIFMKITFSQPYRTSRNTTRTLIRDCNYYIAFSKLDDRFYRLGGFDYVDINDFFKDLIMRENLIFKQAPNNNLVENMNIDCLYNYYEMSENKKRRKGFKCFENCKKQTMKSLKIR